MTRTASLRIALVLVGAVSALSGCTQPAASPVASPPAPANAAAQDCPAQTIQEGKASWYGPALHGEKTASGEVFNQNASTAAHRSLPLGTPIEVTNLENGRKTTLIVNDRGPRKKGRVLDVSKKGAQDLGFVADGTAPVRIEAVRGGCAGQTPSQAPKQAPSQVQASTAGE